MAPAAIIIRNGYGSGSRGRGAAAPRGRDLPKGVCHCLPVNIHRVGGAGGRVFGGDILAVVKNTCPRGNPPHPGGGLLNAGAHVSTPKTEIISWRWI